MDKVIPVLQIDDADEAKVFYIEKLGFEFEFAWRHEPGFPVFMGVKHGDLQLHLSEHGKGHPGSETYVIVSDIARWHDRCVANGVDIGDGPTRMPWGNTEMPVTDPFRNLLRFTQTATHEPTASSA